MKLPGDDGMDGPANRAFELHFTVLVTGGAVLVLEILGTRLLSPYFGNNLYVWSALISVTLLALALGYWIGGRLADSHGSPALLDQIICISAFCFGAIPLIVQPVADPLSAFNFEVGILISAGICFGPPLLLLGTVSPIAIRLLTPDVSHVGRSAGSIYASSTAGSIVGALVVGFILLPRASTSQICYTMGLLLVGLSVGRWLVRSKARRAGVAALLVLIAAGMGYSSLGIGGLKGAGAYQVVMSQPSFYGPVRVLEAEGVRFLMVDGMCQNAQSVKERRSMMPYVAALGILPYLRPSGSELLLVGLGGGDAVRLFRERNIRTTAVEINPVVANAAIDHFGLSTDEVTLDIGDGRDYLNRSRTTYDFVVVDAFAGGSPPYHLFSREAFAAAKQRLRLGGLLAVNIVVESPEHPLVGDLVTTLKSVYDNLLVLAVQSEDEELRNVFLFASDDPIKLPDSWDPPPIDPDQGAFLESLRRQVIDQKHLRGKILTDDLNDVDLRVIAVERKLRQQMRLALPLSLLKP